jgi:hypothetical protein
VARRFALRLQLWKSFNLLRKIGRRVDEKPTAVARAQRDTRLSLRRNLTRARRATVGTRTIPLRQPAAGRATENPEPNRLLLIDQTAPA